MFDINLVNSVYDNLSSKIKTDLDEQFNLGRIKGSDYANVYAQLIQTCIKLAFQTPTQSVQIDNINKDIDLKGYQEKLIDAQTQVAIRQKQGFNDNLKQKLFETQMGAWSTMFNSGLLTDKPAVISNDEASSLYNSFKTELGIS